MSEDYEMTLMDHKTSKRKSFFIRPEYFEGYITELISIFESKVTFKGSKIKEINESLVIEDAADALRLIDISIHKAKKKYDGFFPLYDLSRGLIIYDGYNIVENIQIVLSVDMEDFYRNEKLILHSQNQ